MGPRVVRRASEVAHFEAEDAKQETTSYTFTNHPDCISSVNVHAVELSYVLREGTFHAGLKEIL